MAFVIGDFLEPAYGQIPSVSNAFLNDQSGARLFREAVYLSVLAPTIIATTGLSNPGSSWNRQLFIVSPRVQDYEVPSKRLVSENRPQLARSECWKISLENGSCLRRLNYIKLHSCRSNKNERKTSSSSVFIREPNWFRTKKNKGTESFEINLRGYINHTREFVASWSSFRRGDSPCKWYKRVDARNVSCWWRLEIRIQDDRPIMVASEEEKH